MDTERLVDAVLTALSAKGKDDATREWAREDIAHYIDLGAHIVSMAVDDANACTHTVDLVPGARQAKPTGCQDVLEVVGGTDSHGDFYFLTKKGKENLATSVSTCPPETTAYTADAYYVSDAGEIYVSPPVPKGASGTLEVVCACESVDGAERIADTLPSQYAPILWEFAMHYALSRELSSGVYSAEASRHWQNARALLAIKMAAQNEND